MKHVLLVHGMNGDDTSWVDFDQRLTDTHCSAKKLTLPGHNTLIPIANIPGEIAETGARHDPGITMQDYVDHIVSYIPEGSKAILIGHSMGGAVISHVALAHPDKVEKLIFVGAMMPHTGESILDVEARIKSHPPFNPLVATADITLHVFQGMNFVFQPAGPVPEKLGTIAASRNIPKVAIVTHKDPVIPRQRQDEAAQVLQDAGHSVTLEKIDTGHFPMFDKPNTLHSLLETHVPD